MRRRSAWILFAACLSGCGYALNGTTQKVRIDTVPTGAQVQVDGKPYTTPVELELKRGTHHTVTAKTTYGAPLASHIRSETQWRYQVVDFFITPILGNIFDGASGGDSELVPSQLVIPLDKPQSAP